MNVFVEYRGCEYDVIVRLGRLPEVHVWRPGMRRSRAYDTFEQFERAMPGVAREVRKWTR